MTPHLLVPQSPMFQVSFGLPHPRPLQTQPLPLSVVSHSVYVRQIAFPVSDTTTTIYNVSVPAVVQPSEIHSSTLPFGDSPSIVFSTFVLPNQATTRVQVRPPTSPVHVGHYIDSLPLRLVLSFLKVRLHACNTTNMSVQCTLSMCFTYIPQAPSLE